jgi:UDP-N-acetylglucosamine transferase subunit ALG13
MPFDRMVRAVDGWAASRSREDVFAQIGPTPWKPEHIKFAPFLDPPEFRKRVTEATAIVAHAGMGSIITALELGKPIVVMPRLGELRETRNDHQVATAKQLVELGRVHAAFDENQLTDLLDRIDDMASGESIRAHASDELLDAVRAFIHEGETT